MSGLPGILTGGKKALASCISEEMEKSGRLADAMIGKQAKGLAKGTQGRRNISTFSQRWAELGDEERHKVGRRKLGQRCGGGNRAHSAQGLWPESCLSCLCLGTMSSLDMSSSLHCWAAALANMFA